MHQSSNPPLPTKAALARSRLPLFQSFLYLKRQIFLKINNFVAKPFAGIFAKRL